MNDEEPVRDDEPSASPHIQEGYEIALGRFILEFNQLDNLLSDVIATVLARLKKDHLVKRCTHCFFSQKLLVLDLLKASTQGAGLHDIPVMLLGEIATERNRLAHGHFDQNPFSGEYDIVVKDDRWQYSAEELDRLREKTNQAWMALRYAEAHYTFDEA